MSDEELNALYDSIPAVRIYDMEYNDIVRGKVRYRAQSADAEMFDTDERNEIVIHSANCRQRAKREKPFVSMQPAMWKSRTTFRSIRKKKKF